MYNRKAQFYIIAAVIIVAIIAGLVAVVNYAVLQPQPIKFYDLSSDFEAESTEIVDYGVYQSKDVDSVISNFTKSFLEYAQERDPNLELIYIYGNKDNVTIANYAHGSGVFESHRGTNVTGTLAGGSAYGISQIRFEAGERIFSKDISEKMEHFRKIKTTLEKPGDWVRVEIAGMIHDFNLKNETSFLFVMETSSGEEVHVTAPQEPEPIQSIS